VLCLECRRQLVLKLGDVRAHHAAHRAGDDGACSLTAPESALHLDVKLNVARLLRESAEHYLRAGVSCAHGRGRADDEPPADDGPCPQTLQVDLARDWDAVEVELWHPGELRDMRPDIALVARGTPVAFIEVRATHAVGIEKAGTLASAAIPWIEISVDPSLATGGSWNTDAPLPARRLGVAGHSPDAPWRCAEHAEAHARWRSARDGVLAVERERARHRAILRAARVVDIYRASGDRERLVYRIEERLSDGIPRSLVLALDVTDVASAPIAADRIGREESWQRLRAAWREDVAARAGAAGGFADSPMKWAPDDEAARIVDEGAWDTTRSDPRPLATRFPRRYAFARERAAWFLMPEMRAVHWNRGADDAFAAHPAWVARTAAVREMAAAGILSGSPAHAPITFSGRLRPEHIAEMRREIQQNGTIRIVLLEGNCATSLAIASPTTAEGEARALCASLASRGLYLLFLAHPADWGKDLRDLDWAPAGTTERGWPRVLVHGVGIFRPAELVRAIEESRPGFTARDIGRRTARYFPDEG
jgi:hypothetical protein